MTDLLQEIEATPASYPVGYASLSPEAAQIDPAIMWERIETYTRTRYTAREVAWTIEGREGEHGRPRCRLSRLTRLRNGKAGRGCLSLCLMALWACACPLTGYSG